MSNNTIKPETTKLINALKSGINKVTGEVQTTTDGNKYRYDHYKNRYKSTPYFLEQLFYAAAKANDKEHSATFHDGDYCFHFDRAQLKGNPHGNITYSQLILLKTV